MTDWCHPRLRGVVQNILSDKLLLETDAPYLWGPCHLGYHPVRAPPLIYHIVKEVSQWQGTTLGETLLWARRATNLFYWLN